MTKKKLTILLMLILAPIDYKICLIFKKNQKIFIRKENLTISNALRMSEYFENPTTSRQDSNKYFVK